MHMKQLLHINPLPYMQIVKIILLNTYHFDFYADVHNLTTHLQKPNLLQGITCIKENDKQ